MKYLIQTAKIVPWVLSWGLNPVMYAEETVAEKAKYQVNRAADEVAEDYRDAKAATCKTFSSKGECIAREAKYKAKDLKDKIETESQRVKDKVD